MTAQEIAALNSRALALKAQLPPPPVEPAKPHCRSHSLTWAVWIPHGIRGIEFYSKAEASEYAVKLAAQEDLEIRVCRWKQNISDLLKSNDSAIWIVEKLIVSTDVRANFCCREWAFSNALPGYLL
jgi:hypothetical protein